MTANLRIVPTIPVVDMERAKKFYKEKLGCSVVRTDVEGRGATLLCHGAELYLYQRAPIKVDHTQASLMVENLDSLMSDLRKKGVKFEEYDIPSMGIKTVTGIATMRDARSAWFKDSEGNILAITELAEASLSLGGDEQEDDKISS